MDKHAVLKNTQLFSRISQKHLSALADICLSRHLRKKEMLFTEGDRGFSVFILISGTIRLFKTSEDGQETDIKMVKPGELFAEVILFEETTYPVSAVALQDSDLFMIPKYQFNCLLQDEAFRNDFLKNLMEKLRFLTSQIRVLSAADIETRFFLFLEELYGRQTKIRCLISKKDVAASIGAAPESLSRLLARLKVRGLCSWEGEWIVLDPAVHARLK